MISFVNKIKADYFAFGIVCVLIATLGLSLKAILIKLVYLADPNIDAISVLALRFVIAMPLFLLLLKYAAPEMQIDKSQHNNLSMVVILGAVGFYLSAFLDFSSLAYITAGLERLILFLYPTFVVIITYFIRPNELSSKTLIALAVSYLGVAIVFMEHASTFDEGVLTGVILVFAAAIIFAVYTVASVKQIKHFGSIRFTTYAMTAATLVTLIHALTVHGVSFFAQSMEVYGLIFIMALAATVMPLILMAEGVKRIGASNSSIISTSGPIVTLLLAYMILGETFGVLQGIGAVFIIGGVFLIARQKNKR